MLRHLFGILVGIDLILTVTCQSRSFFDMNCPQNKAANFRKCEVFVDSRLDFIDFKQWTSELETAVTVSLDVTCSSKGVFFLPWPMKARGLIKLNVKGCVLEGFFQDSLTPTNLKDELQELSLENCVIAVNMKRVIDLFNTPLTQEIDCGQQTVQRSVWHNISYMFTNKMDDIAIDEYLRKFSFDQFFNRLRHIKYRCNYSNLKYIDDSISRSRGKNRFLLMTAYSDFPKLNTFRWTDNGYRSVPQELIDWRKYFPQLKLLDLSYNNISKFNFLGAPSTEMVSKSDPLVVDLSQNSVAEIPVDMPDYLTGSVPIIVDLTGNPLRCDCNFLRYKKYVMNALKRFEKYENLSEITCYSAIMHRKIQLVNYRNNNC
ncbi:unnamed protein product [Mytilus coruscus]|uniref:LRRCT domain-containing protein n=1 Tax=Mytilus coruscus TaxID=42192 RepID=A0A6J8C0E0_MYTCO|nr:unnamed protein product [Mytilus coruscus]